VVQRNTEDGKPALRLGE